MKKLFLFLFIVVSFSNVFSQGYLNFPVDTIAKDGFYNYRSLVKFDRNNKIHIVNTRQFDVQSNTRDIFYHNNVSGSFVTTRITNNSIDDNYATLDFDSQNYVHIGYEERDASNLFQIIYKNNRSGNFGDSIWITTGGQNKATPYMCVGKNDSLVHFAYFTFVSSVQDYAYYRNYNYITGVLSPEYLLGPAEAGSENDIEIIADTNGVINIFYATNGTLSTSALKSFRFQSGVITEQPTGVNAYVEYPCITLERSANKIHVIYRQSTDRRIYLITKNPDGTFTSPVAISPANIGYPSYWRAIDFDDAGRLYVTYQNSNTTGGAPKGFFLLHGIPGSAFSQPILVWEDSTATYIGKGSSSVAARGNGIITVAFDPTISRNGNVCSDIYLKSGILNITNAEIQKEKISSFKLEQNFPNPFNPSTKIRFSVLNTVESVSLKIFDVMGKEVAVLHKGRLSAGDYELDWNASGFSGGTYFCVLKAGEFRDTKKMLLLK